MAFEARRHEPEAGTHRMRSGRYAAHQESTTVTKTQKTMLRQHHHLALVLFIYFFSFFFLSRLSTFYLCTVFTYFKDAKTHEKIDQRRPTH